MSQRRAALLLLFAAACSEPEHTNPFDPETPETAQARATLAGTVQLEAVGLAPPSLSGVAVSVVGARGSHLAVTDANGDFLVSDVRPGTYTVNATRASYRDGSVTGVVVTLDDGGTVLRVPDIFLAAGRGSIAGRIALSLPRGVQELTGGASVSVDGVPGAVLTDADGDFLLDGVPAGASYTLTASKVGYLTASVGGVGVSTDGVSAGNDLSLDADLGWVDGAVSVIGAESPAGVLVRARGATLGGTPWEESSITDAAGTFLVSGLPAGSYAVSYELANHVTVTTSATVAPGEGTALPPVALLRHTGSAAGVATLAGALDHSGIQVLLTPPPTTSVPSPSPIAVVVTDASGAWRAGPLPVDAYAVAYQRAGYVPQAASLTVVANATVNAAPVSLAAVPAVVRGTVSFEGGVAGALGGTTARIEGQAIQMITAGDGAFTLPGLAGGTHVVVLERSGFDTERVQVALSPGDDVTLLPVTLARTRARVTGTVTLSAGTVAGFVVEADRSGIVVTLTDGGVAVALPAVTDAAGAYAFADVPVVVGPTTYAVTARKASYSAGTASVAPALPQTTPAPGITLAVAASTLTGTVASYDNLQHDGTANGSSTGNRIDVSGTAFNGTPYGTTVFTTASGAWTAANLPAGTWDVVATSTNRTCPALPRTVLGPAATVSTGSIRCTDAVAPSAPTLATPTGAGAQPGYTRTTSLTVPIGAGTDAVNLRGHEYTVGASWGSAARVDGPVAGLDFSGLAANAANVLWARAVDWVGNAGPAVSATVVHDDVPPPATVLQTPRPYVDATTTSVTLGGADRDLNFLGYQSCSWTQAATVACPGAGGSCTLDGNAATSSAFALSLTTNQRTCVFARGVDRAGNAGAVAAAAVTSDLTLPTPPVMAPVFDPTLLTIHADYVDFFLATPSTDAPSGGGTAWRNVAFLEVDTGTGFTPLCPAEECHPNDTFAPCACSCTDSRLLCSGATFLGVRMPLLGGVTNVFQVRAVDSAGNRGAGVSQQVMAARSATAVQVTNGWDLGPRALDGLLTVSGVLGNKLYELGPDQRLDPGDPSCDVGNANGAATYPAAQPASGTLVVYTDTTRVVARRAGASGLCAAGYAETTVRTAPIVNSIHFLSASGERAAWTERITAVQPHSYRVYVQEPGTDGKLGGAGSPPPTAIATSTLPFAIQLQGSALLVRELYGSGAWTVYDAGAGAFSGPPAFTFPSSVVAAALSSDGRMLATVDTSGNLSVRRPGPSGRYDGVNDVVSARAFPGASLSAGSIAVEGTHVVAFDEGATSSMYHWDAGGDATFGTADDTSAKLLPSSSRRYYPSFGTGLASGVLYFQIGRTNMTGENPDVWSLDLSAFRWDSPPLSSTFTRIFTNRAGTAFVTLAAGGLTARTSDGRQASSGLSTSADADGADLVALSWSSVVHYGPDATGLWFTAGAQPGLTIYSAADPYGALAVGGGKVIVRGSGNTVQVLEPGPGSLRDGVAAVRVDAAGMPPNSFGVAITGPHAFYACDDGANRRACYAHAGPDGEFGTGDDVATAYLRNPSGVLYYGVQSMRAQGGRLIFSPSHGQVNVLDPGADGAFNTADDVEWALGPISTSALDYDLAGDFVAWIDASTGPGQQVSVRNLATGAQRQITTHYSTKTWVTVEPTGRVAWRDQVFTPATVFVSTP